MVPFLTFMGILIVIAFLNIFICPGIIPWYGIMLQSAEFEVVLNRSARTWQCIVIAAAAFVLLMWNLWHW